MCVDEAGNHEPAAEIHDLSAPGNRADLRRAADCDDSIAGDGDGFGLRQRGVAGPDPAVDERQRDHGASGGLRWIGRAAAGDDEDEQEAAADAIHAILFRPEGGSHEKEEGPSLFRPKKAFYLRAGADTTVETVAFFSGSLSDTATNVTFAGAVALGPRVTCTGTAIDSPAFTATSAF